MNRRANRQQEVFVRPLSVNRLTLPPGVVQLPPIQQWVNRIEVLSSSGKRYVIAQHATKRHWGCDCQGWRSHRNCKHLRTLGLPSMEVPYEVVINGDESTALPQAPRSVEPPSFLSGNQQAGREIVGIDEV